ncbi:MadS family sensor histidine kinase [Rhodococcus opacus]|uniref:GAF domain-containing sensor histidine kinase n=1 Tax=Rhodococcus opacus TaxID=37919 RepID=A0AAX3YKA3_RHOOP|nr:MULTISPECIES: GAF domain-containing sensor histidine kinase [Rhodococcus]ELB89554.1 sensor kinase, two-component system [Rhodococcus wratislaviensis IFP 2016]NHU44466.1 GAF domain-containing sensor histidine kinase [Rhodococcus sp. A14]MBA8959949.1 signal transduction histidine kinase [Rhodococcus opacus]MBP2205514.1 signal transduction histidine kinase [Rhodococcus opacus]MCZ4582541.1 GAF domain-containing sensor histidine kinase [Rhodococcus opacus]
MNVPDLSTLTGLRSGKPTFYPQYRGAAERLERVVHALELISRALVRTVEGPETLICAVAEAARAHLDARWVAFALADGMLPDAGPRRLVLGPDATPFLVDNVEGPPLPDEVVTCLADIRSARTGGAPVIDAHHAFVPIVLEGGVVGAFAAWTAEHRTLDTTDGAVLSILASQTAVALQNSALYQRGQLLLERAEHAYSEARRTASDLAVRNAELESTQRQLGAAHRHQVLDEERHRIARELHDSVTQAVLSAGMQIEVCRSGVPDDERSERLDLAKELTRRAVEQLRSAIYALNHSGGSDRTSLPEMLEQLGVVHMPDELAVTVRVGGTPAELSSDREHALLRIAGEALFNAAVHANATRAVLRLTYSEDSVLLSVADDGDGDPKRMRLMLRMAANNDLDGHHRGLANMQARAAELGGTLEVARARIGGVRVAARIPLHSDSEVDR